MASSANFPKIICRVKALYAFSSTEKSSLSFEKDEYIDVLSQLDSGWWDGWCKGNRGWFPSNYVQVIDVNPNLIKEMQQDHQQTATKQTNHTHSRNPSIATTNNESDDDSEEEARTISLIRSMNNPTDTSLSRKQSLNNPTKHKHNNSKRVYPPQHSQFLYHRQQQYQQNRDDDQESSLPDGWVLQVADDGVTKFYFNHKTGGLRWNHPSILDSDDENYDSSSDDYESPIANNSRIQSGFKESFTDDDDFGNLRSKEKHISNISSTAADPTNLMSCWIKKSTPQGKVYYGNSITHETTWNYEDIDPNTGHLKKNSSNNSESIVTDIESINSRRPSKYDLFSQIEQGPVTWKNIATRIAQSVQNLNIMVSQDESPEVLKEKISIVVDAVRHMLYSSRSMDKESSHLYDPEIKESLRVVLSTLAKLILSAKIINDINVDVKSKIQRDANDVLNAVRRFIMICQSKSVQLDQIIPKFISTESNNDDQEDYLTKKKTLIAPQRPKYPLNQDLVVNLQTHIKQIKNSTDALCKASSHIHTLEQKHQQDTAANEEQYYILDQKARSNVIILFQSLSSQIGGYLALLGDIDINNADSLRLESLPKFRCNKQKLYNATGLLFSAIQALTNTQTELSNSIHNVLETVKKVEETIDSILENVVEMVSERKVWLIKNGQITDGPWTPSSHIYFESDNKKSTPNRGNILDESYDIVEEPSSTPVLTRLYNKQTQHQHRPSISTTNTSTPNLSRSVDNKLQRQYSISNGTSNPAEMNQFWFLGYDYAEGDIEFTSEKNIKGGTLRALVERLTLHDYIDMSYIANFLLTYRSFCTTEEFVDLLQERYNLTPPEGLRPDELEIWTDKKQKLVRLRVFNVMKNWLENYYNDEDEFILNKLQFFANTVICDSSSFSAEQLNKLIKKRRELDANGGGLKKLIPNATYGPTPILPKNIQSIRLLETDPLELARQLTIMDFKLYSSIRPIECLGKAWSNEGADNATNVKQSIDYCNRLTAWVTGCILGYREAKKRVVVIKYWSQVANRCLEMNNYNTCMAILSAFDNSAIGRLKRTWELVSSRTSQSLAQIRKLMGSNSNFKEYREMVHSVNPPCIPFLGIYLQDLTFIEDGNSDYLKTSNNLINFAKQQKSAEVIREIKQFQSPPYIFQYVPEIQDFIKTQLEASKDVDFLYERSLELEPRMPVNTDYSG